MSDERIAKKIYEGRMVRGVGRKRLQFQMKHTNKLPKKHRVDHTEGRSKAWDPTACSKRLMTMAR